MANDQFPKFLPIAPQPEPQQPGPQFPSFPAGGSPGFGFANAIYVARAFLAGAQNSVNLANTKVNLDTKTGTGGFDPHGDFDVVTNHWYSAPVTGYYLAFYRACNSPGSNVNGRAMLNVNSVLRSQAPSTVSGGNSGTMSGDFLHLIAGDHVELFFNGNGATAFETGLTGCFLAIYCVFPGQ